VDVDGGSDAVFIDALDPADFPFVLIVGIDIVILPKFLIEVIVLELGSVLSQHLSYYIYTLQKIYSNYQKHHH
jgi:hypothetical protein